MRCEAVKLGNELRDTKSTDASALNHFQAEVNAEKMKILSTTGSRSKEYLTIFANDPGTALPEAQKIVDGILPADFDRFVPDFNARAKFYDVQYWIAPSSMQGNKPHPTIRPHDWTEK